jgi:guanylate kinase
MNVKPVFLLPPSYEIWWQRLLSRYEGKIDEHDLYNRMKTALVELEHAINTDYFYVIINDDLEKAVALVDRIAHGEHVQSHYRKTIEIAQDIVRDLRRRLSAIE